jgi:DNA-binding transcriptional LysR family regulator
LQLLNSLETFKAQMNAINRELKGELNIGITDNLATIPEMRITRALAALKDRGPDIIINIRMIPPTDIETAVLDGQLHVGVVPDLRTLAGLNYIPLYQEKSFLYCSHTHSLFDNKHPTSGDALAEYDAVLPAYPQDAETKQQQKKLKPAATSTDREGIAFLILSGRYIGFLPSHYAEQWVEKGVMKSIQPEQHHFVTQYTAITRKGARTHFILETYLEELNKPLPAP